jgi:hypothetical protein
MTSAGSRRPSVARAYYDLFYHPCSPWIFPTRCGRSAIEKLLGPLTLVVRITGSAMIESVLMG